MSEKNERTYYLNKEILKLENYLNNLDKPELLRYEIEKDLTELRERVVQENNNLVANFIKAIDLSIKSKNKSVMKKIQEMIKETTKDECDDNKGSV